jgi:hypothetical protein
VLCCSSRICGQPECLVSNDVYKLTNALVRHRYAFKHRQSTSIALLHALSIRYWKLLSETDSTWYSDRSALLETYYLLATTTHYLAFIRRLKNNLSTNGDTDNQSNHYTRLLVAVYRRSFRRSHQMPVTTDPGCPTIGLGRLRLG